MMVDIIELGSGTRTGGGTDWIKDLLPVGLLLGAGYLAYLMFVQGGQSSSGTGVATGTGGGRTAAGTGDGVDYSGSGNYNSANPGPNVGTGSRTTVPVAAASSSYSPILGPLVTPVTPTQGYIAVSGPGTPTNYFPAAPAITFSRTPTAAEINETYNNLQNSGIPNAWWSTQQTITQTTQPGGINSAGSYQSDIPVGTRHCPGPGPGAPSTDTWHYC